MQSYRLLISNCSCCARTGMSRPEKPKQQGYYCSEFRAPEGRVPPGAQQFSHYDLNEDTQLTNIAQKFRMRKPIEPSTVASLRPPIVGARSRVTGERAMLTEDEEGNTSGDEQTTGDRVVSDTPVRFSDPNGFLHLRRLSQVNCLNTLLLAVMTATTVVIAAYLSQDSDTVDVMAERVNKYFDIVDTVGFDVIALRLHDQLTTTLDFYEQDALPAIQQSIRVLKRVNNETDVETQLVKAVNIPEHIENIVEKVELIVDRLGQLVHFQTPHDP